VSNIPTLTTDRLLLRPFTMDDVERVTGLLQTPDVAATTLYVPYPYSSEDAATWIATHPHAAELGQSLNWAICDREDGLVMGTIGIDINAYHNRGMLGYWMGVPYWGQGFTSEAAQAVVDYGFAARGLHRIEATCMPHNIGSSRVMEKAGMTYEGTLREYYRKADGFRDAAMYAVLRSER
jgi:RimJ/RimL family protein N-acetyltransferase